MSRAIRIMLDADPEHASIRAFRRALAARIEADIALLDALSGDPDLEPDADAEASLCGTTVSLPSMPLCGFGCGGDPYDLEDDRSDLEDGADREPSLGSLGGTAASLLLSGYRWGPKRFRCEIWAGGAQDERECDAGDEPEVEDEHGTDDAEAWA